MLSSMDYTLSKFIELISPNPYKDIVIKKDKIDSFYYQSYFDKSKVKPILMNSFLSNINNSLNNFIHNFEIYLLEDLNIKDKNLFDPIFIYELKFFIVNNFILSKDNYYDKFDMEYLQLITVLKDKWKNIDKSKINHSKNDLIIISLKKKISDLYKKKKE